MSVRDILTAGVLGALGIVFAVAIAVFANNITGEEIGLASEPVSVVPADSRVRPAPAPGPKREIEREDEDGGTVTVEDSGGEVEAGDDDGQNRGRGRGRGGD